MKQRETRYVGMGKRLKAKADVIPKEEREKFLELLSNGKTIYESQRIADPKEKYDDISWHSILYFYKN